MGVAEYQNTCQADTNHDGTVNVADLLAVIATWGSTGDLATDVNAVPCGDVVIGVADLLAVITHWGNCIDGSPDGGITIESLQDCMDAASLEFTPYSPDWQNYVSKCTEASARRV